MGIQMKNFLLNRESTREYSNRKVSRKKLKEIESLMEELDSKHGKKYFEFVLFKDGKKILEKLDGHGGYGGFMIESPHYVGIKLVENSSEAIVRSAYAAEALITDLTNLDLGSCWVTLKNVDEDIKAEALGEDNKAIDYLIAFGNTKLSNPFDTVKEEKSSRKSIEDIVFDERLGNPVSIKDLEARGLDEIFYYIRFAPSTLNSQPWRFVVKKDKVELYLCELEDKYNLIDAGIIMYYFKELGEYSGLRSEWTIKDEINELEFDGGCMEIGEILL